jgi:hypothetical protein
MAGAPRGGEKDGGCATETMVVCANSGEEEERR